MEDGRTETPTDNERTEISANTHSEPTDSVGIVTDDEHPDLTDDGRAIAAAFEDNGIVAEPFVWTDNAADPDHYDALLFRSCWDYHTDYSRFSSFLDAVEEADTTAFNSVDIVRWNAHKSYLTALSAAGVRTTPTEWLEAGDDVSLAAVLREREWTEAVVKPAVGAGSEGVWRTSTASVDDDQRRFEADLSARDTLVQRFVPAIESGERSIVFVRGAYSHAWNDLPCGDDFSAFKQRGVSYDPDEEVVEAARNGLSTACRIVGCDPSELPYARVDYLEADDGFVLMELELIEPNLELGTAPGAAERLASAVSGLLG